MKPADEGQRAADVLVLQRVTAERDGLAAALRDLLEQIHWAPSFVVENLKLDNARAAIAAAKWVKS